MRSIPIGLLGLTLLTALSTVAPAATPEEIAREMQGLSPDPVAPPVPDPALRQQALDILGAGGALLLIPESTNDRVMAFDPLTGDLIDPDFIPASPDQLSTPIHAILSAAGDSVLVSDQLDDVVQEFDLMTGAFIGTFAPAGGPNPAILDNIRGIALRANGNLLVTVGSGANADAVAEFDTAGAYLGNFVANGSDGLVSPFDVMLRAADALVGGITSDTLHRYDLAGAPLSAFSPIDTFPEQIFETASGNVLVANFSGAEEGVVEYLADGTLVGISDPASIGGYRGVYELANGNILTTNGSGVHEIDRMSNLIETKIAAVSARFCQTIGGEQEVDLGIVKTAEPEGGVDPGDPLVYTLTVTNFGPGDATNVVVVDDLSPQVTYDSDDCGGSFAAPTFTWTVGGLPAMASIVCNLTVTVNDDAEGEIVNAAVVSGEETDPTPGNDGSTVSVAVNAPPVVEIPTLRGAGLALLVVLLGLAAAVTLRRRAA